METLGDLESISTNDVSDILSKIRIKNTKNVIIGHLNINSLRYKFDALKLIVRDKIDILIIGETKLDETFPENQFLIDGFHKPYRFDRNGNGGGVMVYVRKDIPNTELKRHRFSKNVEAIFVEINLRKSKLLLIGTYRSTHAEHGINDNDYFQQIGLCLDTYCNYDKFLIAGDLNVQEHESSIQDFLIEFSAKNLVKDKTCFKNLDNPSCIDLFLTNSSQSFQNTTTVSTGLSDFHKMTVTVMKTTFPKAKPKVLLYRDFSKFIENNFRRELKDKIQNIVIKDYASFEKVFLEVLNKHAPSKKRTVRSNEKPYVTKQMRKAIMKRSYLENRCYKYKSQADIRAYKKQKNYCNRLYKRERRNFYANLNLNNITDNRKFWDITKPLFSNKGGGKGNIVLVDKDKIISDDTEVAQHFNDFFKSSVEALDINENRLLLTDVGNELSGVNEAIAKFENHPSIISIKENVKIDGLFSFSRVNNDDIKKEIKHLNDKKSGTFMNIPTKQLKRNC